MKKRDCQKDGKIWTTRTNLRVTHYLVWVSQYVPLSLLSPPPHSSYLRSWMRSLILSYSFLFLSRSFWYIRCLQWPSEALFQHRAITQRLPGMFWVAYTHKTKINGAAAASSSLSSSIYFALGMDESVIAIVYYYNHTIV